MNLLDQSIDLYSARASFNYMICFPQALIPEELIIENTRVGCGYTILDSIWAIKTWGSSGKIFVDIYLQKDGPRAAWFFESEIILLLEPIL